MIDDVYNARILDFAGNIPLTGELENADAEASAHSKLCGSKVKVWLKHGWRPGVGLRP
jgi:NifU-like protein involved in Fe-S cluster formation